MNLIKMADRLTAKYLHLPGSIKEDEVIALKKGYYTNSGLDMGQYEETRSCTCYVYLDGDEIKGYADWYIDSGKTSNKGEDKKTFGRIDVRLPSGVRKIEEWALAMLRQVKVEDKSKKDWEGTQDNRRRALSKFLEAAYEKWKEKNEEHPAIPAKQPQGTIIPSEVHEEKQFKEIHDKLEASIKELYKIYALCTESSYQIAKDKNEASKLLWSASKSLVDAREEIESAIRLLE